MDAKNKLHHDVIIAWAKGATVQERPSSNDEWVDRQHPLFYEGWQYRVKPEPEEVIN
jgi:hypothetical protein